MKITALVYCENEFGKVDGKVTNGLLRNSDKYEIVGIIDSTKAGQDSGQCLDGIKNSVPIFQNIEDALYHLTIIPSCFIYGIAPFSTFLNIKERAIIKNAIKKGMNIINGLPEFFADDNEFVEMAKEYHVELYDIRKPPIRTHLHHFTGDIHALTTPIIAILGTDCAVGKRTTALRLVKALNIKGVNTVFIATGQTGILQGAKYGVAIDMLSSGFATGEVEHAILTADKAENPDIIIVEGQGALSHPAFTSSSAILKGSSPDAVIVQDAPKRKNHCDYPNISIPPLNYEINLIEAFSDTEVIAITINHEGMTDKELENTINEYEMIYELTTTDVLKYGCNKLIDKIIDQFPQLQKKYSDLKNHVNSKN